MAKHSGEPMTRRNFYVSVRHLKKLREIADFRGVSVSELVRIAIEIYLDLYNEE